MNHLNELILWETKHGYQEAKALCLTRKELTCFVDKAAKKNKTIAGEIDPPIKLPLCNLLDASHNSIMDLEGLLQTAPSVWWVNLTHNALRSYRDIKKHLPLALGLLDLTQNPVEPDILDAMLACHIVRLNLTVQSSGEKEKARNHVLNRLPNVWIFNDIYVDYDERVMMLLNKVAEAPLNNNATDGLEKALDNLDNLQLSRHESLDNVGSLGQLTNSQSSLGHAGIEDDMLSLNDDLSLASHFLDADNYNFIEGGWACGRILDSGNREMAFLGALQLFVPTNEYPIDFYRLDVAMEDYLDEAVIANARGSGIWYKGIKGQTYPKIDMMQVLLMPHKLKMDVATLLSILIILPALPRHLVLDAMLELLVRDYY